MTQTPLQEEEAAGTLAAGADLGELDPTAQVVRDGAEDRSWREPADVEASRAGAARPSLRARLARAPMRAAGVAAGGLLLAGGAALLTMRAMRRGGHAHPLAMVRGMRRR